jgi:NAD(P)-dependent dehydrogenase (short-subunit alcohol dehydrogenase family)
MPDSRCVFITGASRGIGLAFAEQYAEDGWRVFASCRDLSAASELSQIAAHQPNVETLELDVTKAESLAALASRLRDTSIDVLINNAGVYGRKQLALAEVDPIEWQEVFAVNTIAPLLVSRALLPMLERGSEKLIAMLSSKVGSLADNSSGGNYAYRTSKAALNQVVKNLSIELAPRGLKTVALHPGWVMTEMGGPNALISAEESVRGLRQVMASVSLEQSGCFLDYEGKPVPW